MKPVVAFVTARAARGLDEDLPPFEAALQAAGVRMEVVDWDDPTVEWESFDLALLRSTWDYTERLREFLVWVDATARRTTVLNPPVGGPLEHGQALPRRARPRRCAGAGGAEHLR